MAKVVRIVEFKGQYRITIPKVLVQIRNWKAGTKLGITQLPDGTLAVKEMKEAEETERDEKTAKKRKGQ